MMTSVRTIKVMLGLAVLLNIGLWFSVRGVQARWMNVPPAPDPRWAASYGLGDAEFSYRMIGLMIQNLGDTGGRSTSLKDYNYDDLTKWFYVEDHLNSKSNYIPYLAGYYFGALQEPEKYMPAVEYLAQIGARPQEEKWRWLAQAVFIARFRMNDMDLALEYANRLSKLPENDKIPSWARNMRVFVMTAMGENDAAYALTLEILKAQADKMQREEVVNMKYYICQRILAEGAAKKNPLCEGIPPLKK